MNNKSFLQARFSLRMLSALVVGLHLLPAYGQFGPPGGMNQSSGGGLGAFAKLFGENSGFSATMEIQAAIGTKGETMTMPGKIAFLDGKSRFEMDMTQAKGSAMRPEMAAQMKAMGMADMVNISRPDKKLVYLVYPGLQAYAEQAMSEKDSAAQDADTKIETTELGKETVDGHACIKNKVILTDKKGAKHESTVWNATDLKKFPIKIQTTEGGNTSTILFKDVKLAKPEAKLFDPPSDFKGYASPSQMMQEVMMKRFGGGQGIPPQPKQ